MLLVLALAVNGEISEVTKEMVLEWSPKFWLHSEEAFRAANPEFHIKEMEVP